jgi:hypothetical protein
MKVAGLFAGIGGIELDYELGTHSRNGLTVAAAFDELARGV